MTFELAIIIVIGAIAVVLGLVCYHLLGRLEMLERSVQGGLQPPSTRLSREQFERRFRTAHARSELARSIGTGLVLFVGAEHTPQSDLVGTLDHLPRKELISVRNATDADVESLGVTTTPFLFIIDSATVRMARPLAGSSDLAAALADLS